jgi:hypothetical protein
MSDSVRYRGVSWHARDKKWRVKVKSHGRHIHVGNYDDAEIAARVFDCAASIIHGPNAIYNFDGSPPPHISKAAILQRLIDCGAVKA